MIECRFLVDFYDKQTKKAYRKGKTEIYKKERFEELQKLGILEPVNYESKITDTNKVEVTTLEDKKPRYVTKYPKGIKK